MNAGQWFAIVLFVLGMAVLIWKWRAEDRAIARMFKARQTLPPPAIPVRVDLGGRHYIDPNDVRRAL